MGVLVMTTETRPPEVLDENEAAYKRAKQRVEELRGFYVHLMIYLVINAGLFLIDLVSGGGWWFYWPAIGWGIGLGAHAVATYAGGSRFGPSWEDRKIRELMERERR
jgi:hypothetical protein